MLRHEPRPSPTTISDRELGIAALVLLLTVVLTALIVPAIV